MLFNCKFYNICILNRYLYTEYDNIGLTLKDLAINKVNIVKKDNRPFDRLERALLREQVVLLVVSLKHELAI
jgi:hypothetical protein